MKALAPLELATSGTLPKLQPSTPFHYLHHPQKWEVAILSDGTGLLVPILDQLRLQPGVAAVAQVGNGSAALGDGTIALAQREKSGWMRVPHESVTAWGETQPDYCLRWQGAYGSAHEEAWMKLTPVGGGRVEREWDGDGYARWRASLVDRGIIKPITPASRLALKKSLQNAVVRRRVNDRNAVALSNSEQFERKLRILQELESSPRPASPPPAQAPAPVQPPAPQPDTAPLVAALSGIQEMLASLAKGQQALARANAETAARLAALEKPPEKKSPEKKPKEPKADLKAEPKADPKPESDLIE